MRSVISWWLSALGAVVAATSLMNLFFHFLSTPMSALIGQFIEFYRKVREPIIGTAEWPIVHLLELSGISIRFPSWLKDIHTLSFVGGAIMARAESTTPLEGRTKIGFAIGLTFSAILFGITGFGLLILLGIPNRMGFYAGYWMRVWATGKDSAQRFETTTHDDKGIKYIYGREGFAITFASALFFALNAMT